MPVSEQAQRIHDELFPGRFSTLKQTDPELIEYFDNFGAVDDHPADPHGEGAHRPKEILGAEALANLHVGNDRARLIDVLTQLVPYLGYPRTLNALRVVDDVTSADAARAHSPGEEP